MTTLDWIVITVYLAGMIGLSVYLGRGQEDADDYYVGGRNLPWWAVGISTMATQTSAVSFISIPAFVALVEGGGLTWLQYELSVPLAMIVVMVLLIPFFRSLELVSVYEYLELRYGPRARSMMSIVFLLSRGLGTGVGVYASAIVLEVCLGTPLWATILLIGVVTVIYDTIGGMAAVVYSDVVQMVVLVGGLLLCIAIGFEEAGGAAAAFDSLPPDRWRAFDPGTGIFDGAKTPFWGFLVGGLFLYISYYGVDQSQAQRELSAPTLADTKRSLVLNGLLRFPLTVLYLILGIAMGAAYLASPELQSVVPAERPDYLVPQFILHKLPTGLRAVLFAAILAAAMSSLDSALNSLSASTMKDFIERRRALKSDELLRVGRITTVIWGAAITGMAFLVGGMSGTIVEAINKIGSAFYGPILASFLVGVLSKRVNETGVIAGVIVGVAFNLGLWIFAPGLYWMWWNLTGLIVAAAAAFAASALAAPPSEEQRRYTLTFDGIVEEEKKWLKTYAVLITYFVVILSIVVFADDLLA
ncbi:MAG: sodium/solute symporter [Deltaproteobacteria bacterium]